MYVFMYVYRYIYKSLSLFLSLYTHTHIHIYIYIYIYIYTGELGYDGPLYDGLLAMTDDMLGPSPMHINYMYWTMRRTDSV